MKKKENKAVEAIESLRQRYNDCKSEVTARKSQIYGLEQEKRTRTVSQTPGKGLLMQNMKPRRDSVWDDGLLMRMVRPARPRRPLNENVSRRGLWVQPKSEYETTVTSGSTKKNVMKFLAKFLEDEKRDGFTFTDQQDKIEAWFSRERDCDEEDKAVFFYSSTM